MIKRRKRRSFKKVVRQGHSKRNAEAYVVWYVEALSEARTQPTAFFKLR